MKTILLSIFALSIINATSQTDAAQVSKTTSIKKNFCPYYKVKITLNSGQIHTGYITSEDCETSETMSDENLMKQIKTVKATQENAIEMKTDYNALEFNDNLLGYYSTSSLIKLQKIEIKSAMVVEKTNVNSISKFSDYRGSTRMINLMKAQNPVSTLVINFSDDDCDSTTSYILINYHPKITAIDLRKFAEANKETFIKDCDETNNDAGIKKLLEPLNIVYFKQDLDEELDEE